jgi:hypothetical protein
LIAPTVGVGIVITGVAPFRVRTVTLAVLGELIVTAVPELTDSTVPDPWFASSAMICPATSVIGFSYGWVGEPRPTPLLFGKTWVELLVAHQLGGTHLPAVKASHVRRKLAGGPHHGVTDLIGDPAGCSAFLTLLVA